MPARYLALLRGINVGGKSRLATKDLIGVFADSACEHVKNYIQTENVIFDAHADVPARLTDAIADRFGYRSLVVLRTAEEFAAAIANSPFLSEGCADDKLRVYFLADQPDSRRVGQFDPDRSPSDRFEVRGREVYLRLPNGMARSRLTNGYFDSKPATTSTGRNGRTVTKLLDLIRG